MSETYPRPNYCLEYRPTTQSILFCDSFINLSYLSFETGISISHLSLIFAGKRNPSLKAARKIAEGLGMSMHAFLKGMDARLAMDKAYSTPAIHTTESVSVPE